jgi:mRNA-degrading endonuclease toxin of MazEF toxin-antitoxin module
VVRIDVTELAVGSEAGAAHSLLAVVVQSDQFRFGRTLMVIPLTTNLDRARDPFGVRLTHTKANGLKEDSVAMCWQVMSVERSRIQGAPVGSVAAAGMDLISKNVAVLVDFDPRHLRGG